MVFSHRTSPAGGFTILEILMAISLSLVVLGIGTAMAFQSLPVEKRLTRVASRVETMARKASLMASMHHQDTYVTVHPSSMADDMETVQFPDTTISVSRPGRFARFETPSSKGYRWKFGSNGLCEPLCVRITCEGGIMEFAFDPLTGEARDRSITVFSKK